jgi:NtrC-family two-component system response regulator AlgB
VVALFCVLGMSAPLSVSRWSALVVHGDAAVRNLTRVVLEWAGARVLEVGSGAAAITALDHGHFDAICLDLSLGEGDGLALLRELRRRQPEAGVIAISGRTQAEEIVEAVQAGAMACLTRPFTRDQLRRAASVVLARRRQRRASAGEEIDVPGFSTRSPACSRLYAMARRAAVDGCTVLLRGESGTGKNVLADLIWRTSGRAEKPKVDVHCPALFGNAMGASELFGHRKGAFTGAIADVRGKLDEAQGGTVFLDEVGDLQPDVQAQLLRVLQDGTYWRLGDPTPRHADVRILAATNRDLEADVLAGRFREDLFHRLDVITLTLLPLRERREDVLTLARAELRRLAAEKGLGDLELSAATEELFDAYAWPGNLRELHHALARAVVLHTGARLEPGDFGFASAVAVGKARRARVGDRVSLAEIEREHIAGVIAATGSLGEAAEVLGIDPRTLERKRRLYELK